MSSGVAAPRTGIDFAGDGVKCGDVSDWACRATVGDALFSTSHDLEALLQRMTVLFGALDRVSTIIRESAVSYCLTSLCLIVLIWAALKFRSWYQDGSDTAADRAELLVHFKDLERRGELTGQEFRSIEGQLLDNSTNSCVDDPDTDARMES
jgi:hypothetical protein